MNKKELVDGAGMIWSVTMQICNGEVYDSVFVVSQTFSSFMKGDDRPKAESVRFRKMAYATSTASMDNLHLTDHYVCIVRDPHA